MVNDNIDSEEINLSIARLNKDLREAAKHLSHAEARYLVDAYYLMQKDRIRSAAQLTALTESGEPATVLSFVGNQSAQLESRIKTSLDIYSANHPVGQWARSHKGVGPVLAAGLLAHIDIHKAPTVGHIWRFAGLDPTLKWEKGEKRPWNARLKVVCWKLGESFTKVSGDEEAYYGQVYKQRKAEEVEKNERGDFKDQAAATLAEKNIGKSTDAYKHYTAGKLPPARIQLRAQRYAVKLFLSHLHDQWYRHEFKTEPPKPYPIAILGHAHVIPVPRGDDNRMSA